MKTAAALAFRNSENLLADDLAHSRRLVDGGSRRLAQSAEACRTGGRLLA